MPAQKGKSRGHQFKDEWWAHSVEARQAKKINVAIKNSFRKNPRSDALTQKSRVSGRIVKCRSASGGVRSLLEQRSSGRQANPAFYRPHLSLLSVIEVTCSIDTATNLAHPALPRVACCRRQRYIHQSHPVAVQFIRQSGW